MTNTIRIQMMDTFAIYINERKIDLLVNKSRKGASLIQLLIAHRGKSVSNSRLLANLWGEGKSSHPENALKTLVSRLRVLLNQISPGLGSCIVADRGAYHWACLPGMTVDLYEIDRLLQGLEKEKLSPQEQLRMGGELLTLYQGDMLQNCECNEWAMIEAISLHERYLQAIYHHIDLLKEQERHAEVIGVCRRALECDQFDDRLHLELMRALVENNRTSEAVQQYRHAVEMNYRYLGVEPSAELKEFFQRRQHSGRELDFSLASIRADLMNDDGRKGAFVCEYAVFREMFNLLRRNLKRLGIPIFLALIKVRQRDGKPLDKLRQNNVMYSLMNILSANLREGDTITRAAPSVIALLLPTVTYSTGQTVMERLKEQFYRQCTSPDVVLDYRIGPLDDENETMTPPKNDAADNRQA